MPLRDGAVRVVLWALLLILVVSLTLLITATASSDWFTDVYVLTDECRVNAGPWRYCIGAKCFDASCNAIGSGRCREFAVFRGLLSASVLITSALCIALGAATSCMTWAGMPTALCASLCFLAVNAVILVVTLCLATHINSADLGGTEGSAFGLVVTAWLLQLVDVAVLTTLIHLWSPAISASSRACSIEHAARTTVSRRARK